MKTILPFLLLISGLALGQPTTQALRDLSDEKLKPAILELKEFVALPNDALYPNDIKKNIEWLEGAFRERNFSTQILPTSRTPLFFAEKKSPQATSTVLFYMHFDGQSVDPSKWDQDSPWESVLKKAVGESWEEIPWSNLEGQVSDDWRMFGRSTSDDKGPIVMLLQAMDILSENKLTPSINIKVILDGEEEKGSQHLPAAVEQYKEILSADHLIINDGPMHLTGEPTLIFGCRGITRVDLGGRRIIKKQHSGHYGNYAPNPAFRLSRLLSSMKDENGRVIIDGYYDGIQFNGSTKQVRVGIRDKHDQVRQTLGIAKPEQVGANLQESLQFPSLNVRGLSSGWVGNEARTIVPSEATAAIDVRLVPESEPERLKELIRNHIEKQGYYVINRDPTPEERLAKPKIAKLTSGGNTLPFRTAINSPTGKWLAKAMMFGWEKEPVKIRIMGGTVPIATFINQLNIPAVVVPLVNPDNNQHSPNENLRLGNIKSGIRTFLSIMLNAPN